MDRIPLSPYSIIFWLEHQLQPSRLDYHLIFDQDLKGRLDASRLQRAIDLLIASNPLFSSCVIECNNQCVWNMNACSIELQVFDKLEQLNRYIMQPFDLAEGPLCRFGLIEYEKNHYRLIFTVHHIVLDGRSTVALINDLSNYYNNAVSIRPSDLLNQMIIQVNHDLQQKIDQLDQTKIINFWQSYLLPEYSQTQFNLPLLQSSHNLSNDQLGKHTFIIERDPIDSCQLKHKLSSFNILMITWAIVIARFANQSYCVVSYPYAVGQSEMAIGSQVNRLLMPIDFSNGETFADICNNVMLYVKEMRACSAQDYPLWLIKDDIKPAKFNVGFSNASGNYRQPVTFDGISAVAKDGNRVLANNHIQLFYIDAVTHYEGIILYDKRFVDQELVRSLPACYQQCLRSCMDSTYTPLNTISLLSNKQHQQFLDAGLNTNDPLPASQSLFVALKHQFVSSRESIAIQDQDRSLTYSELGQQVDIMACRILSYQVSNDSINKPSSLPIALCLTRGIDVIIMMLAVMRINQPYVMIDMSWPQQRIINALRVIDPAGVVTNNVHQANIRSWLQDLDYLKGFILNIEDSMHEESIQQALPNTHDGGLLALYATSGTTSEPKFVAIPDESVINQIAWMLDRHACTSGDTVMLTLNHCFSASRHQIFYSLLAGARLLIGDCQSPRHWLDDFHNHAVSHIYMVASQLQLFLDYMRAHKQQYDSLKKLFCGSESVAPGCVQDLFNYFPNLQQVDVWYGQTEASACVAKCYDRTDSIMDPHRITLGRPIWNTQLYILDAMLMPTPAGVVGELFISGLPLALGYWGSASQTQSSFLENSFVKHSSSQLYSKLLKTGDLVRRRENGDIEYVGRRDDRIKLHGNRIELREIQYHLLALQDVVQAEVLIKYRSVSAYQHKSQIIAFFVANNRLTENDLMAELHRVLPETMIPSRFVQLNALPLTSNGKVDRQRLLAMCDDVSSSPPQLAQTASEQAWAQLWCQVLNQESVGVNQTFSSLGGDSLDALKCIWMAKEQGLAIDPKHRLSHMTIQQLINDNKITLIDHDSSVKLHQAIDRYQAPIVCVHPNQTCLPFFMIHPAVGGALSQCERLARAFSPQQTTFLFDSYNLYHLDDPLCSIEQLANHYSQAIRILVDQDPCILLGWSLGGVIAVEIAHRIIASGGQVHGCVLIDSNHLSLKQHHMMNYLWNDDVMNEVLQTLTGAHDSTTLEKLSQLSALERTLLRQHIPTRLDIPCMLIRSNGIGDTQSSRVNQVLDVYQRLFSDSANGWSDALSNLVVHDIATDHLSMMDSPYLEEIVRLIEMFVLDVN